MVNLGNILLSAGYPDSTKMGLECDLDGLFLQPGKKSLMTDRQMGPGGLEKMGAVDSLNRPSQEDKQTGPAIHMCAVTNAVGDDKTSTQTGQGHKTIVTEARIGQQTYRQLQDMDQSWKSPGEGKIEEPPPEHRYDKNKGKPPKFISKPQPQTDLQEGERAHFECRVIPVGDPDMRVEWYKDGAPIRIGHRFKPVFESGYVSLDVLYTYPEDSGTYLAVAHNPFGEDSVEVSLQCQGRDTIVTQTHVTLESLSRVQHLDAWTRSGIKYLVPEPTPEEIWDAKDTKPPVFTQVIKPQWGLREGQPSHFEARLLPIGDPNMTVEWFKDGKAVVISSRLKTLHDFGYTALDILSTYPEDEGVYSCIATNKAGQARCDASLTCEGVQNVLTETLLSATALEKIHSIDRWNRPAQQELIEQGLVTEPAPEDLFDKTRARPPVFRTQIQPVVLLETESAHFECQLVPIGDPTMVVEWLKDGEPIKTGHRFRTLYDFGYCALDILYAYPEDNGTYTCRATNKAGQAICSATLVCEAKKAVQTEAQISIDAISKLQAMESSWKRPEVVAAKPDALPEDVFDRERPQPPKFKTHPLALTNLQEGDSAHFEFRIAPVGDPDLKVDWYKNGMPIQQGSRFRTVNEMGFVSLDILYVYPEDSGTYTVVIHNKYGEVTLEVPLQCTAKESVITTTHLTLESLARIKDLDAWNRSGIRQLVPEPQPEDLYDAQRAKPAEFTSRIQPQTALKEGQSAHFEARLVPIGDPNMTIEWLKDGQPIKFGNRFKTLNDFGYVALDILYAYPEDNGTYTVKATNKAGQMSCDAPLKCEPRKNIITETYLTPEAMDKIDSLDQWQRPSQQALIQQGFVPPPAPEDMFDAHRPKAPQFKTQVEAVSLRETEPAHLECRLAPVGDPNMKVEWFKDGVPIQSGHRFKTLYDFGYCALDILYTYPEDNGTYTCQATNEAGQDTTQATVYCEGKESIVRTPQVTIEQVQRLRAMEELWSRPEQRVAEADIVPEDMYDKARPKAPKFKTSPQSLPNLKEGDRAHFECNLAPIGDPDMRVEWYKDGAPVQSGHRFKPTYDFGYCALDILYTYPEDNGTYTVVAHNRQGEDSVQADIKCEPKAAILTDTHLTLDSLGRITDLDAWNRSGIKQLVPEPQLEDMYDAQKSKPPVFMSKIQPQTELKEGQPAHFEARLVPIGDPNMKVEWLKDGQPLKYGNRFKTLNDFGYVALDILYSYPEDNGTYTVRAVNMAGQDQCDAPLKCEPRKGILTETHMTPGGLTKIVELDAWNRPPQKELIEKGIIPPPEPEDMYDAYRPKAPKITQIQPVSNKEAEPAHFECRLVPIGDPNMKVEWFKDGVPIKFGHRFKGTNDFGYVALDILYAYPEDNGTYTCRATNKAGQDSTEANLTCEGKAAIITEAQVSIDAVQKLKALEEAWKRPDSVAEADIMPEDIFDKTRPKPPQFRSTPQPLVNLQESDRAHFECNLVPIGDPDMRVDWYKDGAPIQQGSRFKTVNDFGYVALDILYTFPEDNGTYTAVAHNQVGEDSVQVPLKCEPKESVITKTHLTLDSLSRIQDLDAWNRSGIKGLVPEPQPQDMYDAKSAKPPEFTTRIEPQMELKEGQPAHFEARLVPIGDPNMKVEWFKDGQPVKYGNRFKTLNDFGYVALDILYTYPEDNGTYTVTATNPSGQDTCEAPLQCEPKKKKVPTATLR